MLSGLGPCIPLFILTEGYRASLKRESDHRQNGHCQEGQCDSGGADMAVQSGG